jgi:hypothetical protein
MTELTVRSSKIACFVTGVMRFQVTIESAWAEHLCRHPLHPTEWAMITKRTLEIVAAFQ